MATLTAGDKFVTLGVRTFWAQLETKLPSPRLPYIDAVPGAGEWGPGWFPIRGTANGIAVTKRSPTVAITTEEQDRIGSVRGEGGGVAVGLQLRKFTGELLDLISNHVLRDIAAQPATGTDPATPAFSVGRVETGRRLQFMLGWEGVAIGGSLFPQKTLIRNVAYCVESTVDAQDIYRQTGADALLQPTLTLEAIPSQVTAAMVSGTGIPLSEVDPDGKYNFFRIPLAA